MIRDSGGTWRLIGTVSWADHCAVAGRPTNFAWIGAPSIRPWIVDTLERAERGSPGGPRDDRWRHAAHDGDARSGHRAHRCAASTA